MPPNSTKVLLSNVSYWLHAFGSPEPTNKNQQAWSLLWNYMGLKLCKSEPLLCSSVFSGCNKQCQPYLTLICKPQTVLPRWKCYRVLQCHFNHRSKAYLLHQCLRMFYYFPPWECGERFAGTLSMDAGSVRKDVV